SGKLAKQQFPDATLRPAHEAVIDCLRRAIFRRAIAPTATALNDEHDPANHPPVVYPFLAPYVPRQQRLYPTPLFIVQPEKITSHLPLRINIQSESATDSHSNKFIGSGPLDRALPVSGGHFYGVIFLGD